MPDDVRRRRAVAIAARMSAKFPYADYGRAYYRRGTPENIARFGATFKEATPEQQALRRQLGFTGRGLYRGRGGYWGRGLGGLIGGAFGQAGLGAAVGDRVGDWLSNKFRGSGEYVNTNDIVSLPPQAGKFDVPVFTQITDGGIVLSNKEYVTDIFAPAIAGAFQNNAFSINPGIERTFPWLCQVAENYEEYTLKQCIFTYKATVADFAASSGQVGQVIMATQYNAAQQPFTDKQSMMQYAFAASGKTSQDMLQGVECDPVKLSGPTGRFVRNGPLLPGSSGDLNMYDHGVMNIAIADCPSSYAGQQMGELWVSYTIELRKPKFVTANGYGISRDVFVGTRDNTRTPFGTLAVPNIYAGQQNSIGCTVTLPPNASTGVTSANVSGALPLLGTVAVSDLVCFTLNFPTYYDGNLRISWRHAPIASNTVVPFTCIGLAGSNVQVITDIPLSSATGSFTWTYTTGTEGAIVDAWSCNEMHIRVSPPTGGGQTRLMFCLPAGSAIQTNQGFYLDISEYNRQFNYRLDGTNDRLVLQNAQTLQIANL